MPVWRIFSPSSPPRPLKPAPSVPHRPQKGLAQSFPSSPSSTSARSATSTSATVTGRSLTTLTRPGSEGLLTSVWCSGRNASKQPANARSRLYNARKAKRRHRYHRDSEHPAVQTPRGQRWLGLTFGHLRSLTDA